jgi:hypothetical protein
VRVTGDRTRRILTALRAEFVVTAWWSLEKAVMTETIWKGMGVVPIVNPKIVVWLLVQMGVVIRRAIVSEGPPTPRVEREGWRAKTARPVVRCAKTKFAKICPVVCRERRWIAVTAGCGCVTQTDNGDHVWIRASVIRVSAKTKRAATAVRRVAHVKRIVPGVNGAPVREKDSAIPRPPKIRLAATAARRRVPVSPTVLGGRGVSVVAKARVSQRAPSSRIAAIAARRPALAKEIAPGVLGGSVSGRDRAVPGKTRWEIAAIAVPIRAPACRIAHGTRGEPAPAKASVQPDPPTPPAETPARCGCAPAVANGASVSNVQAAAPLRVDAAGRVRPVITTPGIFAISAAAVPVRKTRSIANRIVA